MKQQLSEAQFCCYFIWLNVFMSFNSHFPCAPPVTDGYMLQQVGVPPSHPPPLLSTFSSKTPWEHGTGTDLLPRAQVLPSTQPHIHTSRYHTVKHVGISVVYFSCFADGRFIQEVLVWAVGQPLPVPLAQSTAPPPTKPSQTLWTHSLILATWGEALEVRRW